MKRQFTATVYILENERTLLIFHRKLQKWLPPGGHIDPNETPPEAALREALEETGLHVELIKEENVWIEEKNAVSMERPYLCLLEEIPEHKGEPAHQHMDMIYLSRPVKGELVKNDRETDGLRWFTWEEIAKLKPDEEIYKETQDVLKTLIGNACHA